MNSLYPINHQWFKSLNSDVAYMLGFITADGNVYKSKKRNATIGINIHKKDICVLEYFKLFISPTRPIEKSKKRDSLYFRFNSDIVAEDLLEYNISPRKTGKEKFPKEKLETFASDYLRGLFDGDGCVRIRFNKKQNTYYINFELSCSSESFLYEIKKHFNNYGNIAKFKKKKAYRWCVNSCEELQDIYNQIYYDEDKFCLTRKRNIFKKVFEDINTHKAKR